jgi:hypothetical protein
MEKWIVYESDESGNQFEIILRSFPNVDERREKLSLDGGRYPRWGPAGSDEVYYLNPRGEMMAVSVALSPTLTIGAVTKLFDWEKPPEGRSGIPYDVSPIDGRFLTVKRAPSPTAGVTNVSVVLNWHEELRRQLPR